MTIVIILLGIALAVSLAFNLGIVGGGQKTLSAQAAANTPASTKSETRSDDERSRKLENDLDKKKKELEEVKKAQGELKDELKAVKRKLHDQRETEKSGDDLAKARADVERQASIQLESTRAELATALADIQKLKTQAEGKKSRPAPAAEPVEKKEEVKAEKPQEVITRVIRELSDVEKERIHKLEAQSAADRKKANELDRELKSLKAKLDRHQRDSKRVYQEADLARDKFRAIELRLNRTLGENDLLKRAIKDLEKKSGVDAGRLELTPDEVATGDASMKARFAAEDAAAAEAKAKLEAAPATHLEEETPAAPAVDAAAPAAAAATPAAPATETPAAQA